MNTICKITLTLTSLTLAGCSALSGSSLIPKKIPLLNTDNCLIENAELANLLEVEHQYLNADAPTQQGLLKGDTLTPYQQATLLSNPDATREQLSQSLKIFTGLSLLPTKNCVADRYLYLRFRHAQAQLSLLNETFQSAHALKQSEVQVMDLQKQIKALTDIEQSITRQRKEQ